MPGYRAWVSGMGGSCAISTSTEAYLDCFAIPTVCSFSSLCDNIWELGIRLQLQLMGRHHPASNIKRSLLISKHRKLWCILHENRAWFIDYYTAQHSTHEHARSHACTCALHLIEYICLCGLGLHIFSPNFLYCPCVWCV